MFSEDFSTKNKLVLLLKFNLLSDIKIPKITLTFIYVKTKYWYLRRIMKDEIKFSLDILILPNSVDIYGLSVYTRLELDSRIELYD